MGAAAGTIWKQENPLTMTKRKEEEEQGEEKKDKIMNKPNTLDGNRECVGEGKSYRNTPYVVALCLMFSFI